MATPLWRKAEMSPEQRERYEFRALGDRAMAAARNCRPCPEGFDPTEFALLCDRVAYMREAEREAERKEVELKHSMTVDRLRQLGIEPAALAAYLKDLEGLD